MSNKGTPNTQLILYGGGSINGDTSKWVVYNGKTFILKWMIWGYPYIRKPPYGNFMSF